MRGRDHDNDAMEAAPGAGFELPPGATFEPDPQSGMKSPQEDKYAP